MRDYIVFSCLKEVTIMGFFPSFSFLWVVVIVLVILGSAAMQKEEMYLRKKYVIVTNCQKALDVV